MLSVPMHMLWTVSLFLEETSKCLDAATQCATVEVKVLSGKTGTVRKPKGEGSRDQEMNGIANALSNYISRKMFCA